MKQHSIRPQRPRGAVVVFTAVCMVTFLGFAALAVDIGYLYVIKAHLQNAADASALAAAGTMYGQTGLNRSRASYQAAEYAARNLKVSREAAYQQMDVTFGRIEEPFRYASPFVPVNDNTVNAVRVVVYRDQAHGNPVPLMFANIFGKRYSDLRAVAVAGLQPPLNPDVVPIALRTPTFGPVDPSVAAQNPGKDGPSYPLNGESFQIGERVTVFAFGNGPRQPIHLVFDLPEYNGVSETQAMLEGRLSGTQPMQEFGVGTEVPIWNNGSGNQNFGQALIDRMSDGNPENDTILMPIVDILPDSRDYRGLLTGNVVIVDFVAVHLDGTQFVQVQDPRFPSDPTRTLTIKIVVGTVVPKITSGPGNPDPAGLARGVFTLQLLR